jgi:hypothetical protein
MSLGSDREYEPPDDIEYDDSGQDIFKSYLLGKLCWTTKNQYAIRIACMETYHIKNCLKISKYPNKENWDIVFKFELKRRK